MRKTHRNILILILFLLLVLAFGIALAYSTRVTMNPAGTVGNTAGNLNNGGLFCEYNGTVYFSNRSEGGCLCAMDVNEDNVRELNTQEVRNILAGGKYLYFYQSGPADGSSFGQLQGIKSFNRCELDGDNSTALTTNAVVVAQLVDNYLYLLTDRLLDSAFYKIKIDKSEQVDLANYFINPACARDGIIYYQGTQDDHYLYALDTRTDSVSEIWQGNLAYPVLDGDYVYYMDVANNYRLCRYSLSQNIVQILTEDRVDCFNVGSGYIYYQKNGSGAQLKCMFTDGSNARTIAMGNYYSINMTSHYVYFQEFGNETSMFHSPIGSTSFSTFAPVSK